MSILPRPALRTLPALALLALCASAAAGCVSSRRCCPRPGAPSAGPAARPSTGPARAPAPTPAPAPLPKDAYALYDGATGAPVALAAALPALAAADLVAFGELHEQPGANRFTADLWQALTAEPGPGAGRPGVLAMEFLERDAQPHVDAYLAGTLPEAEFVKLARQSPAYATSHRPLVEHAKARGLRVLAANAPRRLVTAFRKQEESYEDWKAAQSEADRALLPRTSAQLDDAYRAKFLDLMGPERGAAFFKAQSLWDDAMAEAIADARAAAPTSRVLFVVGAFHVQSRLGTLTKYAQRRPDDKVALVTTVFAEGGTLALPADAKGTGDYVLVVAKPPPQEQVHP